MITVIGFNTAIDRLIRLDTLRPGEVSRALDEQAYPGGKGLHVAQTIAALGERVQLVGLVDPAHRNMIGRLLCERGVVFHGIEVAESLRTCIALQDADGQVTEILGQGPLLDGAQQEALLRAFRRGVDDSELIVLSGSLPRGFSSTTYAELAAHVRDAGKRCLIDAGGELLQHAAQTRPFLVKPNRDEIAELLGRPIGDLAAAVDAVRELHAGGIAMPVVTMGAPSSRDRPSISMRSPWRWAMSYMLRARTSGRPTCFSSRISRSTSRRLVASATQTNICGEACPASRPSTTSRVTTSSGLRARSE